MKIRTKLTLQFLLLGGTIMIIASVAIYLTSAGLRRDAFYNRLRTKARLTASLVLEGDLPDTNQLKTLDTEYLYSLHNEKIIILNYLNDIVYSTDREAEIAIRYDVLERVRLYQKMYYRQGPYEVLGTLYTTRSYRYVVLAAATDIEGINHLRKLKMILAAVLGTSLLLFYFAGILFAGRALKPITSVIKRVEEISETRLDLRVPVINPRDELGQLAETFNKMLRRLQISFGMQKDFIANASHELRTPLTSINGQLEVLLNRDRPVEEYKATIASVLEDIKSLSELTNRLLLLAKTTSVNQPAHETPVRIDELMWQIKDDFKKFNKTYNINISLDESLTDSMQITATGDESLLKTAFMNIADNACKYSDDHSVIISLKAQNGCIAAIFSDKGIGISKTELLKVNEPFYRSPAARNIPGTGIGLPLVNHIIKLHQGTVQIESEEGIGTRVTVMLPVAL
jgi:signal transduction histidine kinase